MYNDSAELWKESVYIIEMNEPESRSKLENLYQIAVGNRLQELAPDLPSSKCTYEPAQKSFDELAEKYYEEAMVEYDATNWENAKKSLSILKMQHIKMR